LNCVHYFPFCFYTFTWNTWYTCTYLYLCVCSCTRATQYLILIIINVSLCQSVYKKFDIFIPSRTLYSSLQCFTLESRELPPGTVNILWSTFFKIKSTCFKTRSTFLKREIRSTCFKNNSYIFQKDCL